jgi:hypothetical protein
LFFPEESEWFRWPMDFSSFIRVLAGEVMNISSKPVEYLVPIAAIATAHIDFVKLHDCRDYQPARSAFWMI